MNCPNSPTRTTETCKTNSKYSNAGIKKVLRMRMNMLTMKYSRRRSILPKMMIVCQLAVRNA